MEAGGFKIGVLIVEDHRLISRILAGYVNAQPDMEVVGEAADGEAAVSAHRELDPDVVLMDISAPETEGLEATREIRRSKPGARILMLTAHASGDHASRAAEAGARGYLSKSCTPSELMGAIRKVHAGEEAFQANFPHRQKKVAEERRPKTPALTKRELEIVRALAAGKSNKQIARSMRISERTVRNHASSVYRKFQVYDRTQAVLYAARQGLVNLSGAAV